MRNVVGGLLQGKEIEGQWGKKKCGQKVAKSCEDASTTPLIGRIFHLLPGHKLETCPAMKGLWCAFGRTGGQRGVQEEGQKVPKKGGDGTEAL